MANATHNRPIRDESIRPMRTKSAVDAQIEEAKRLSARGAMTKREYDTQIDKLLAERFGLMKD